MLNINTKIHENTYMGFGDIEHIRFPKFKFSKGNNSVQKCRWPYGTCSLHIVRSCFIFVQSFMKISKRVLELLRH